MRLRVFGRLAAVVLAAAAGCSLDLSAFFVRVSIASDASTAPAAKVFVEGGDGDALTGALVTVQAPDGRAEAVGYSAEFGCYAASPASRRSGLWRISVHSAALGREQTLEIEHRVLAAGPGITQVMDALGNSGTAAATLDPTTEIALAWTPIDGATAYQITVYRDSQAIYAGTASGPAHLISAGSLPAAASLLIAVSAYWQSGDPLYRAANFCSAASAEGAPYRVSTR